MSSIVSIDTRGYDISMGPGFLRVGGGGGIAGNVYINGNVGIGTNAPTARLEVAGTIKTTDTTPSTDTTSGALQVAGGIGIGGRIYAGGVITTTTALPSTDTTTGALVVAGGAGIGGRIYAGGVITTTTVTPSGNTTTGALVVAGGAGIGGAVNIGGTLTSTGLIIANNALTLGSVQTLNFGVPRTAYITSGANTAGTLDILNQVTGATSKIRIGTNNSTSTGMSIDNTGLVTTSAGITVNGTTSTNKMLIQTTDYVTSLTTQVYAANTWYQAIPVGTLISTGTYIVTLTFSCVGTPWGLSTSFLFQGLMTNGHNNSVGAAVPTAAHDTGASDYQIYVRGKSSGAVSSGIEFKISSTTASGDWAVRAYRII